MFRPAHLNSCSVVVIVLAFAACAVIAPQPTALADDVASFLEEQGLDDLLAVHLEQQLGQGSEEEQRATIRKLAELYATMLETQTDEASRTDLEARAKELLKLAGASDALGLRVALAQATYRQIESIAERHRLRSATPEDVERAAQMTVALAEELTSVMKHVESRLEDTMRKLGRASGAEASTLADRSEVESRLRDQSSYLLAWTLYYQAWLTNTTEPADEAETLFAKVLGTDSPRPAPEDVSVDLRAHESIARAILGMALCKSLTRSSTSALQWIDLLQHERTAEVVRKEVPAWRLAILLEHSDFTGVEQLVKGLEGGLDAAPTPWLRLIAAWALEARQASTDAAPLARQAMTSLAARGALDHLLDLADRYGADALGSTGFAPLYVQAVLAFQKVRADYPGDKPAADARLQTRFADVADLFKRAVDESDASQYPGAAANAAMLYAWCRYFESKFLDASDAFEAAAVVPANPDPSEATWMAIVCLEYIVSVDENAQLQKRMAGLIDRYLERYPAGKHVPELLLRQSYANSSDEREMIESLLSVPPESPTYHAARQRASLLLYKVFRNARGEDRKRAAMEFLAVQQPQLADELDATQITSQGATTKIAVEARDRLVIRCRQVLDAATTAEVNDLNAAMEAMAIIDQLHASAASIPAELANELDCRRVQIELMAGRMPAACAMADTLWTRSASSTWAQLATRAVFRDLLLGRQSSDLADADLETLELIVRYGGRVIQEFTGQPNALARSEVMTYHVIVAEASFELWQRTHDSERANAALFLFDRLLAARPDDARFLRATAELSGALGQNERALQCWRTLLAGLKQGSDAWYEAKFHQIETLAAMDAGRALEVLKQHVQLEGGYGPEPWGAKLKVLEAQLNDKAKGGDM